MNFRQAGRIEPALQVVREVVEVGAVACDAHHEVFVLARVAIGVEQYLAIDQVGLELHTALIEVTSNQSGQVLGSTLTGKQATVDSGRQGGAVWCVACEVDLGDGVERRRQIDQLHAVVWANAVRERHTVEPP